MPAAIAAVFLLIISLPDLTLAVIQGPCADCHTMHNSQGGTPMTFNSSVTPNENLLRGSCFGCHAMGIGTPIYDLGTDKIPQVYHNGVTDLAAGNFRYINSGGDNRGHNIDDLTGEEIAPLTSPPGMVEAEPHPDVWDRKFSCTTSDDTVGCHGYRKTSGPSYSDGISGSHHSNVSGQLASPTIPADSYRFLYMVKGFEDPDWEENPAVGHNEYYGEDEPIMMGCSGATAEKCHAGNDGVKPPDGTMSQFCAECHANFHTLDNGSDVGIGADAASPFLRHPTDLLLPGDGEYQFYTTYNNQAPVARTEVPAAPDNQIRPGQDAVMCLSCHRAHASNYPDMLRWNYTNMVVGSGITDGCFTCHTTKN